MISYFVNLDFAENNRKYDNASATMENVTFITLGLENISIRDNDEALLSDN